MSDQTLILASASPRRAELLTQIGVRFVVAPADIDESQREAESPVDYVTRMAVEKAAAGCIGQRSGLLALGADTAVVCDGQVFGKPTDRAHAQTMLLALAGKTHTVLSAVAVDNGTDRQVLLSETRVTFRDISADECFSYWQTGEPLDKAGGYAIQGLGAVFITHLEGSYTGVVGLPIAETETLLRRFAVPVWQSITG
ncbi:MAG: Maf family protein [Porticoccaceae bacterium]